MDEGLVGNANVEIEVRPSEELLEGTIGERKKDSHLLGQLLISRGGLEWRPRGGRYHGAMTWEEFAELMESK